MGDKQVAPIKLITILQEQDLLLPTSPEHLSVFYQLLARISKKDDTLLHQDASQRSPSKFSACTNGPNNTQEMF